MELIELLTTAQKELMLSKSFYALPDNPSDKHFSAGQVKRKGYEPLVVLFDLINQLITAINTNITSENLRIADILSSITTLQGYFTDGKANKAIADEDNNNIKSTYATNAHFDQTIEEINEQLANMAGGTFDITQSTFVLVHNELHNIDGDTVPVLSASTPTLYNTYPAYIIKRNPAPNTYVNYTEDEAKQYMQTMTGYPYLPKVNTKKVTYFLFPDGSIWRPIFDDTYGMVVVKLHTDNFEIVTVNSNSTIKGNKIFNGTVTVQTPTSNGHAVTKKYVDDMGADIRAVAEGKCKTFVISDTETISNIKAMLNTFPTTHAYNASGDDITDAIINGGYDGLSIANAVFNDNTDVLTVNQNNYLIAYNLSTYSMRDGVIVDTLSNFDMKIGDILLITNTLVPDRWYSGAETFYKMETSKVDLNNVLKKNENALPTTTNTYDLGSSSYAWHDVYVGHEVIVQGSANLKIFMSGYDAVLGVGGVNTLAFGSSALWTSVTGFDLGRSGNKWRDLYLTDNIKTSYYTFNVDEAYETLFNMISYPPNNTILYKFFNVHTVTSNETFTMTTAKTGSAVEYKGKITNNAGSAVTLTFNAVSTILCNDDNITITNGTNSTLVLPASTTIEYSIVDGKMVAINFDA